MPHPPLDPHRLRADFPILSTVSATGAPLVYLDNAASSQRPRQVIDCLTEVYERHYANVHRGIHRLSEKSTDLYEQARDKVRAFLGAARPEEIVFTRGTTEAINLVARSWGDANLRAGDEILLTQLEHHSNIVPWQQAAARTGAIVRFLPIADDGQLRLDLLPNFLTDRTRLVAVTAVSNVLGTLVPVAEIAAAAHSAGALTLVDAAQGAPHEPLDVQAIGCDFLAFSGHKLLGPSGVGALWGRAELLAAMPPFQGGGSMIHEVTERGFSPAPPPARFEAGTPAIAPVIGLGAALDYLRAVGLPAIQAHERHLTRRAHERLDDLPGVRILGPAVEQKAGIVCFEMEGIHPHDVAQILDRHGVAIRAGHHCAQPLHARLGVVATARASFYLYNTLEEVDQFADALIETQNLFRDRPRRRRAARGPADAS